MHGRMVALRGTQWSQVYGLSEIQRDNLKTETSTQVTAYHSYSKESTCSYSSD